MEKKTIISFSIPFLMVIIISIIGVTVPVMIDIDYKLYDAALLVKPLAPESGKFLNVEVDDTTLDLLNMYPLKRSTIADAVLVLKELGAAYILLDTMMVDPTPPGINLTQVETIPQKINQAKNSTLGLSGQLLKAYAHGQIGGGPNAIEEADEYFADLEEQYDEIFKELERETDKVALDYDEYISKMFSFVNNIYSTNDFEEDFILGFEKFIEPEFIKYLEETQSIKNITINHDPFIEKFEHNPTIEPIMKSTIGSGFVATALDNDGVVRKTDLLYNKDGYYYPQLSFRYYLDAVGNPEVIVNKDHIMLRGVKKDGKEPYDLRIPISPKGEMVVNWAGRVYEDTFRRQKFYLLYEYDELLRMLKQQLQRILTDSNLNTYALQYGFQDVLKLYTDAEAIKEFGDPDSFEDYKDLRIQFIEYTDVLLNGSDGDPTLDIAFKGMIDSLIEENGLTADQATPYTDLSDEVSKIFENARVTYKNLVFKRQELLADVEGATITLGYTATSTFDLGANPFEKNYFNMGMYSTVANNLFAEKFIVILPYWVSILLAFILVLLSSYIIKKVEPNQAILLGSGLFIGIIAIYLLLFRFTGIYIYFLIPGLSYIVVFIQRISGKLLSTSKDKAFIKNAFGQYLSEDVIKDILDDPSKLELGGEQKEITAFFTDIMGFSTFSEKLTPDELVNLLNEYLTAMSDIALDNKGTIDKYEGDAIIGFFGAPGTLPDHATKAIITAIRMKEKEKELNVDFLERGITPTPISTRIGINSGPCVVGNMGTPKKMDYTMMGSDVNIAARLEGVNKQYGTWILTSEATMGKAEDIFLVRKLDRVRVVGINNPIRLYNPIAIRDEATETQLKLVETFDKALNLFEERDWKKAKATFREVIKIDPEEKPSVRYVQMCDKFIKDEPEADWDGVFNLTSK